MAKQQKTSSSKIDEKSSIIRDAVPKIWVDQSKVDLEKSWSKSLFWGISGLAFVLLLFFSQKAGINGDDAFQNDYAKKLWSFYTTGGSDTSALNVPKGNMHLYGGFFDLTATVITKTLGLEEGQPAYHKVRHAWNAVFGFVAILFAGLLAARIAGNYAGIFTMILLLFSPRFLGEGSMNPKDIPFAAGYIMAIYGMVRLFDTLPGKNWKYILISALGMGIALGTRAGGLLLFVYLVFFAGVHFFLDGRKAFQNRPSLKLTDYIFPVGSAGVLGYTIGLFFWPFALVKPFSNPLQALSSFTQLEIKIRVLFEGTNFMSDKTPWNYAISWIILTIPLFVLLGYILALIFSPALLKRFDKFKLLFVAFAGFFPVFYVIYKDSVLHDGWRHLTFSYAPNVILVSVFLVWAMEKLKEKSWIVPSAVGVGLILPLMFIFSNSAFPYTYFNELTGGTKGAYGNYETDYWGLSAKQAVEYLEAKGIVSKNMKDTIVVCTNFIYPVQQYLAPYRANVKVIYLKYDRRNEKPWQYGIFLPRFSDGSMLRAGTFPPTNSIHTINADGIPLATIIHDKDKFAYQGFAAAQKGDFAGSLEAYKKEVAVVKNNELAYLGMANAYMNLSQLEEAKAMANKTLELSPDNSSARNLLGLYSLNKQDIDGALNAFSDAIGRDSSNFVAFYYSGYIRAQKKDFQYALGDLQNCLNRNPSFKPAYELAANIYQSMGDPARAQQMLQAAGMAPK
jgi:tetratricopeptide (TPR) repeat protein